MDAAEVLAAKADLIESVARWFARRSGMDIDDARQVAAIAAWKILKDDRYEHGDRIDGLIWIAGSRALEDELRCGRVTGVKRRRYHAGDRAPVSLNRRVDDGEAELLELIADPSEACGNVVDSVTLGRAIATLPERERFVVYLYFFEDISQPEIGELLGVSNSRISQLLAKACKRLRPLLADAA